jgi:hypothetical protein
MSEPSALPASAKDDVNEQGLRDAARCPLCDYSLRGLTDPRCPECGYAFDWKELLYAELHRHRYLFEHQAKHNVWSFVRTLIAGLRPSRFWKKLRPTQEVKIRRLVVYWVLTTVIVFVGSALAGGIVQDAMSQTRFSQYYRSGRGATGLRVIGPNQIRPMTQSEIEAKYPLAYQWQFYPRLLRLNGQYFYSWGSQMWMFPLAGLYWVPITLLTMMIFMRSLASASVRPIQMFRVII